MSIERRPGKIATTKLRKEVDAMLNKPQEKEVLGGLLAPRKKNYEPEIVVSNETQRVLNYMKIIRESGKI